MDDVVEILFSFPLVIKQSVGSVVNRKLSESLPAIGFPFVAAISEHDASDAIARVLGLTVGFELGEIRALAVAFDGAVHDFDDGGLAPVIEQ